jgi:hypothetical protein
VILSIKEGLFIFVLETFLLKGKSLELKLYKRGNNILELRSSKFIQEFGLSILE